MATRTRTRGAVSAPTPGIRPTTHTQQRVEGDPSMPTPKKVDNAIIEKIALWREREFQATNETIRLERIIFEAFEQTGLNIDHGTSADTCGDQAPDPYPMEIDVAVDQLTNWFVNIKHRVVQKEEYIQHLRKQIEALTELGHCD